LKRFGTNRGERTASLPSFVRIVKYEISINNSCKKMFIFKFPLLSKKRERTAYADKWFLYCFLLGFDFKICKGKTLLPEEETLESAF
jgi:hypothetical protein